MAPRTGGSFAVWSALFETMSGGLAHVRHKEDPWNSILAGGFTSAFLSIRKGFRPAFSQFLIGGALLACIEGVTIMTRRSVEMQSQNYPQYDSVPSPVPEAKNMSEPGWLRWRFGRGKDDDNEGDNVSKTKVLESVDTLPPPMPTFNFQ
ncbi:mitochondrial import inner membrane translocase subunit TIM17-1-like [Silene latifolia]|uniref:mitochondrial import inner membrane translocase subunit TIM17-1-like n=1 Tax=Silene latifolia TaxID=37657 RepID=UPI003D7743F2